MLQFVSKQFENKLVEAIRLLKKRNQFEIFIFGEFFDPTEPDFKPDDYDDMVLGWDDILTFSLPRMDDDQAITYRDFIDLAEELERIEIRNQVECWTNKRFLLRVEFIGDERLRAILKLPREGSY